MITVAIGDIHGMYSMLASLLSKIDAFARQKRLAQRPRIIFLGDYVDRGPDSRLVVRRVRALQSDFVICLRGNHEDMMARCKDQPIDWQNFLINGGKQTLESYAGHEEEFDDDRRWAGELPTSYEDEKRIFVHAGIMPRQPLAAQTDYTKMWVRSEFLRFSGAFPKYVVHGHTPTIEISAIQRSPDIRDNRCNVDTGAYLGGTLSAAIFNTSEAKPFDTISVE